MIKNIIKYRFILILLILFFAVINIESPFSYRHYENEPILLYFLITISNCLIYIIPSSKFIIAEKVFYAFLVSCISLVFGTGITGMILVPIYGSDPNFDTLQSPIILNNLLFYFSTNLFGIGLFWIWLKYRKEIYT